MLCSKTWKKSDIDIDSLSKKFMCIYLVLEFFAVLKGSVKESFTQTSINRNGRLHVNKESTPNVKVQAAGGTDFSFETER